MVYQGRRMTRGEFLAYRVTEERRWLEEHGATREGYIDRYGSASDPEHYGDGGEAIYAADRNALRAAEEDLKAFRRR